MSRYIHRSELAASAQEVFTWHERPGAFERLAPPWEQIRLIERSGGIRDGARTVFEVRKAGLKVRWTAVHRDYRPGEQFADEQIKGPFSHWVHLHRFLPVDTHRSIMEDQVEYRLPLAMMSRWLLGGSVERSLRRMFAYRHAVTARDISRHRRFAEHGPLRVAISGASGLIGSSLAAFLGGGGHTILKLVRRPARAEAGEIRWQPEHGEVDRAGLEGVDAVVHLAGENVGEGRWTPQRKAAIRASRVKGTRVLCEALARLERKPRVLICASAIGYYGDRGEQVVDEDSPAGVGFLPEVCGAWEAAAEPARQAGIRVVHPRIGMVLAARGGGLARMLPAFKAGLGGPIGGGEQYVSWIGLDDLLGVLQFAMFEPALSGPVNAVSPGAVRQVEFARVLGAVLRRPAVLPVPGLAVRTLMGEMGESLALQGSRVRPARLEAAGFAFNCPDLQSALRHELGLYAE